MLKTPISSSSVKQNIKDWTIEQITRETYKYADMLAMSAKKDAMVPMGGLLCMKDDSFFDVYTECRTFVWCRKASRHGGLEGGAMERLAVVCMTA